MMNLQAKIILTNRPKLKSPNDLTKPWKNLPPSQQRKSAAQAVMPTTPTAIAVVDEEEIGGIGEESRANRMRRMQTTIRWSRQRSMLNRPAAWTTTVTSEKSIPPTASPAMMIPATKNERLAAAADDDVAAALVAARNRLPRRASTVATPISVKRSR